MYIHFKFVFDGEGLSCIITSTVHVNKMSPYSTVVSFPHYSSSTVVLTVISVLVN